MVSELVYELMQSKLPSLTIQVRASLRLFEIERVVLKKIGIGRVLKLLCLVHAMLS